MRSIESGSAISEIDEDGGENLARSQKINVGQLERNGITLIDFNNPPKE